MINVLIPCAVTPTPWGGSDLPRSMYPINDKPMLQTIAENFKQLSEVHFIFMLIQEEADKFHTDRMIKDAFGEQADVIVLKQMTKGSLCSCLMAVDFIDNEDELLIGHTDVIIQDDLNNLLKQFRADDADCAVPYVNTTHPGWLYLVTEGKEILNTEERRPISDRAIAGLYYFKHGKDFIESAKNAIRKGYTYDGNFYLTGAINGMILKNRIVRAYELQKECVWFENPERVKAYEESR